MAFQPPIDQCCFPLALSAFTGACEAVVFSQRRAQPLWRGVGTSKTEEPLSASRGLGTGSPLGDAATACDRLASRVLAFMGLSSAFLSCKPST